MDPLHKVEDSAFFLEQAVARAEIRISQKRPQILDALVGNLYSKRYFVPISKEMLSMKPEMRQLEGLIEADVENSALWSAFKLHHSSSIEENPLKILPSIAERLEALIASIKSHEEIKKIFLQILHQQSQILHFHPSDQAFWDFTLTALADKVLDSFLISMKAECREIVDYLAPSKELNFKNIAGDLQRKKPLREDEFLFSPLPISSQSAAIPEHFAKYRAVYEWNRYNQVHYSSENPPPRKVIRYEFYIRYPGLSASSSSSGSNNRGAVPQWKLENGNLIFSAPGFSDLIFPGIREGEWDRSERHGFVSCFENDLLTLCFSFKQIHYRLR